MYTGTISPAPNGRTRTSTAGEHGPGRAPPPSGARPRWSVVVVAGDGTVEPARLAAIGAQCAATGAELVLVQPDGEDRDGRHARAAGLERATGQLVAFLDARRYTADLLGRRLAMPPRALERVPDDDAGPALSVVVPAHDAASTLGATLDALAASALPREAWELIVVDDASRDATPSLAARSADVLVRLEGREPFGPAYARNRGAELALGATVVFVDADVAVRRDTLPRLEQYLDEHLAVAAVCAAYAPLAASSSLVTRHRALLEHFEQCEVERGTDPFRAACAAVRASVFRAAGMFDEWHFGRPLRLEDVELGRRLQRLGHRVAVEPAVEVEHLKRWTLGRALRCELQDRGMAAARMARSEAGETALLPPPRRGQRGAELWAWGALALAAAGLPHERWPLLLGALGCVLAFAAQGRARYDHFRRHLGVRFLPAALGLDLLGALVGGVAAVTGWLLREVVGEPRPGAIEQAYAEMGVSIWPPVPRRPG